MRTSVETGSATVAQRRTRTAGIRKRQRAKGTVYEVRFRDPEGRQRSASFPSLDAARAFHAATHTQVRHQTYVAPASGRVTFLEMAEAWFATTAHLKRRTRVTYRSALEHNLAPLHQRQIGRLDYEQLQQVLTDMASRGRQPSTIRNTLMVARLVLDEAVRRKLIPDNPARHVRPPRVPVADSQFLTVGQVQALAAELPVPWDLVVLTAAGTGLRSGELMGLRVRHLDLLRRRLHVRETVALLQGGLVMDTPKSRAGRRTVPMSPGLATLLEVHIADHGLGADCLVFGEPDGQPRNHNRFYQRDFRPAASRAGLPESIRFHDLRHTYASLMIAADVNPKLLSAWMGHTSVALTLDRYGHLYDDDHVAPSVLDRLYRRGGVPQDMATGAARTG